ncbi:universal stress protein [Halobellus ruber]|uniref:Universal stress protein n=1 Tax=Halobellus ruber TaxID=2761102 RepID=A0A7J9SFG7_9EURY|nr:universal stress protein [Halobellus ruber]MBB6644859.1 universal stress protein [Halobellus ruber]
MHLLIPFDIVPTDSRVPQDAFGVAPASERAIRYAFETYGRHDELRVTAVSLSTDAIDLEENLGAADIRSIADELDVNAEVSVHSVQDADSIEALQREVLDLIGTDGVDAVVMGYEEDTFADAVFAGSTPERVLEERATPVVLVP